MYEYVYTKIRVESFEIMTSGTAAYDRVVEEWNRHEWVEYLHEHGTIEEVDTCKEFETDDTIHRIKWRLLAEEATMFYLKYGHEFRR